MWFCAIIGSIWIILTAIDIFRLNFDRYYQWLKGIELVFLIPAMLLPLLVELPFLVYFVKKRNKQAIVLSIIQGFFLLVLIVAIPLSEFMGGLHIDKEERKCDQFTTIYSGLEQMPKEIQRMQIKKYFEASCQAIQYEYSKEQCLDRIKINPFENPLSGISSREAVNLPVPKNLSAEFRGKEYVSLTYDYSMADYFNIYRSASPDGPWELISADLPSCAHGFVDNSYNLPKNAGVLYYRIAVSDGQGGEGPYSPIGSVNLR